MRILVTGAAGFIGTNFVHYWVQEHPDDAVVALDALTYAGSRENLADIDVPFVHADIGDTEAVGAALREYDIDTVVNFAAESHNSLAVLDPGRFLQTNVLGTQRLLDACRSAGVARFHHISTCEVYGDLALDSGSDAAFTEQSPYRPRTPYNASKAGSDHVVRAYHETFDVPVTITNCANNYGPYQFPEKVLPLFITYALRDRPLPIYTSADHRREWLHVRDHCTAIDAVLHRGRIGATYNVGSGLERTVTQLADDVLALLGKPQDLRVTVPDRPGHDRRYLLDSSVLRTELGWRPEVDFAAGLADTVRWYAEHRAWWSRLQERSLVTESSW
ncbi:MAG TPA: dTDP-glucose 4,6-dehydratase [Mycobacteriales bacterium]|nr:dTDP-glucose 4,6-dehydratase [Mycobacteriales bacterium]